MTRPALRTNNQPAWRMWVLKEGKLHSPFWDTPADSSTFLAECRHGAPWPRECACAIYYRPTPGPLAAVREVVDLAHVMAGAVELVANPEAPEGDERDYALTLGFPIGQWEELLPRSIYQTRKSEGYRMWKIYVNATTTDEDRRALAQRYDLPVVTGDLTAAHRDQLEADARQMSGELSLSATKNTQNLRSLGNLAAGLASLGGLQRLTTRPR